MEERLGTYKQIPITDVWKKETLFSEWLSKNLQFIIDVLNLEMDLKGTEQEAGGFSIDVLATDSSGEKVVIENQYGKSDHDHLGKLITYTTFVEAKTGIWICEKARPEHIKAINVINSFFDASFFLIEVKVGRVDDSLAFPMFNIVSNTSPEIKKVKSNRTREIQTYIDFWEGLLEKFRTDFPLHAGGKFTTNQWMLRNAGIHNLSYVYFIFKDSAAIELSTHDKNRELNKERFDALKLHKEEIEERFGEALIWGFKEEKRQYQKIRCKITGFGLKHRDAWGKIQDDLISTMKRLVDAMQPYVDELK